MGESAGPDIVRKPVAADDIRDQQFGADVLRQMRRIIDGPVCALGPIRRHDNALHVHSSLRHGHGNAPAADGPIARHMLSQTASTRARCAACRGRLFAKSS